MGLQGKTIGQYQLIELIHQGQNTIYKGFQPSINRHVAVKVLSPSLASDPASVQRFNEDMGRIAGLSHPNLLPIYDYGQQDDQLYIVSRYVETGTLKDRLPPAFSPQQAQAMITPIAEALADEAYQEGLISDAEAMADLDAEMGTDDDEEMDMGTIEDAQVRMDADQGVIANAENWMAAAYRDAAAALLAAELIDEGDADAVAGVIADAWVVDTK